MKQTNIAQVAIVAASLTLGLACGGDDEPTGPVSGTLVVELITPAADDGAIVLNIIGPNISDLDLVDQSSIMFWIEDASELRAVIVGGLAEGELLKFTVPDVKNVGAYTATVFEVADLTNALRSSLVGYGLTVKESIN